MIDIYNIPSSGWGILAGIYHVVVVYIMYRLIDGHYRRQFKAYTDAMHEQYTRAIEQIKARYRA